MLNVSEEFKTAINGYTRNCPAKVIFQIVDTTAKQDATAAVTAENTFSKKDQVFDTIVELPIKYGTFETDYWKLDGTFGLPPKSSQTGYEVGWWSSALSDVNGDFAANQEVTITFSADHSSIGISIWFDTNADEYAEDFTIEAYDSLDVLIDSVTVTGNTTSKYKWQNGLDNYRKLVISISKTNNPYRRARITEFAFGIIEEYTSDDLINLDVLEDLDTTSTQVTSNETKFTITNEDLSFNILNPTGIYPYLQRLQKIQPYIGVTKSSGEVEYANMGTYYLKEWASDSDALTASFTSRDILDVIAQSNFSGASYTSKTLYYIAQDILDTYGGLEYEIDSSILDITTTATIAEMNYREALQLVCIAAKAVMYSDRYGKIIIERLSDTALTETVNFDIMYTSPKIELDILINTIVVDVMGTPYTYVDPAKPANEQTLSLDITNSLIVTNAHALEVATWVLAEYKKRFKYDITAKMNPAYEVGDIITVEDDFSENKTMRILKQEFKYQGYLEGKINGKGSGT